MSDFDVDLEGVKKTQERFAELKEQYEGDGVTYVVGTAVEYAVFLEFGTEDMPPYPWFRPAVREYKANPETFIIEHTGWSSIDEIPTTKALVQAVANALENRMTDNVSAESVSDRSPGTHPDHPQRDIGNLAASIQAVRVG